MDLPGFRSVLVPHRVMSQWLSAYLLVIAILVRELQFRNGGSGGETISMTSRDRVRQKLQK